VLKPLLVIALALPLSGWAESPRPYIATYQTKYGMLSATGERRLDALPDGRWKLEHHARVLMVDVSERTTFTVDEGRVNPLTYDFVNPLSKDRSMSLIFDWSRLTVTDKNRKQTLPIKPGVFDKLGYQAQMQMNVCANPDAFPGENYTVVDRGRLKTYRVEFVGRQPLKTAVGILDTIQLRQFRPDKRDGKDTKIWLATEWRCLLARLDQQEGDDIISLKLVKATVAGTPVKGS
jgi:hypothetical protein